MNGFDLGQYLPYLVNRLGVALVERFDPQCRAHGIDIRMWRVLAALHQQDGQTISALAQMTAIDLSTLSRLLNQMQRKRLIERQTDAQDRRATAIHRTAAGARITQALIPEARKLEQEAARAIAARDLASVKRALAKAYGNVTSD